MTKLNTEMLRVDDLRLDGDTQPRVELDTSIVHEYAEHYEAGKPMPPLAVFFDGTDHWLVDGFHRRFGAVEAKVESLPCLIRNGTLEDARWFSYAANQRHGLRRSNEDKRKAVKAALKHPSGAKMSDRQIAEHVGVSNDMVSRHRKAMEEGGALSENDSRTGKDGRTINTAKIGKSKRTVERDVALAANIPEDVQETIADTPIANNKSELAKLASLPEDEQRDAAEQIAAGEVESVDDSYEDEEATDLGKCPNCNGTKWEEDEDGFSCKKCHHPWGEPAGDVDEKHVKNQRTSAVRYL